jgi:regulator of RNase E activity RraA
MSDELLERCRAVATSTWSDALDQLGVAGVIHGLTVRSGTGRVAGTAVTVKEIVGAPGSYSVDAFAVGSFLDVASSGAILIVEMGGAPVSTFGGLAAQAAVERRVSGVVIDGGCRDVADVHAAGLWLASRHITPVSGKGRVKVDGINVPITVCGIAVNPGDYIIADETGVVCVNPDLLMDALPIAEEFTTNDTRFANALRGGGRFSEITARLRHL